MKKPHETTHSKKKGVKDKHILPLKSNNLKINSTLHKTSVVDYNKTTTTLRIPTAIPGLDEIMEGGLREKTANLIIGGPGTGKSIFAMEFLVNGIDKFGENGILISFEETVDEILQDMSRFGWELEQKIKDNKLVILHYTPEQVKKVLNAGGGIVRDTIESINAKRIVIDSLTELTLLDANPLAQRKTLLALFKDIKEWGCTALITGEQEQDIDEHHGDVMEFEASGVILLYHIRKNVSRERFLEIFKMRGTRHASRLFPMKIEDQGIVIYSDALVNPSDFILNNVK